MEESILQKWHHRSLELQERQHQEALQAEQIEGAGGEGEHAGTNVPQDIWQHCEIIEGKWESGKFEWPHMKLGKTNSLVALAISSIAVSHDVMLVAGGYEDGSVYVWRMDTGVLAFKLMGQETEDAECMAFSLDSHNLAAGASSGKVMVWDIGTGEVEREITAHDTDIWCIAYSPDGNTIATGSADCTVKLWNTDGYSLRVSLTDHPSAIQAIQFSPDSTLLVSASQSYGKVWDVANGNLLTTLAGHDDMSWNISFSPDSRCIITNSEDWTVSVWDAKPDSTVSICDSFIGTRPLLLRHVKSTSTSGCYSLDSEFIVTGYEEGSINVRSTRRGTLADLKGHRGKVKFVTVTADNKYIVSTSEDDSIRIWSLEDICRLATAL